MSALLAGPSGTTPPHLQRRGSLKRKPHPVSVGGSIKASRPEHLVTAPAARRASTGGLPLKRVAGGGSGGVSGGGAGAAAPALLPAQQPSAAPGMGTLPLVCVGGAWSGEWGAWEQG